MGGSSGLVRVKKKKKETKAKAIYEVQAFLSAMEISEIENRKASDEDNRRGINVLHSKKI